MRNIMSLCAAATALVALPAAAQSIVNGDFEAGNTGFASGYTYVGSTGPYAMYPEGTYTVGSDAADYHNLWANVAAYSGSEYLIANGAPGANVNVWDEVITGLTAGKTYDFSAYVTSVCCNASFGGPNGTAVIFASADGVSFASASADTTGVWKLLSGSFVATAPSMTLALYNDNSVASGNDFGVDKISLATGAVPEPASWALMIVGIGAVGAMMRRRVAKVGYAIA